MWCILAASAEYVACMEDVLDQYERPYDAQYPQVCFDEGLKQHIPNETILEKEIQAITNERNSVHAIINWQFRTEDARIKLKQLYPSTSA